MSYDATNEDALRFVICGSVGGGKSTLLARLLDHSTGSGEVDPGARRFSCVKTGIEALTDDIVYTSFSTPKRSFVVADIAGHEFDIRHIAAAASRADVTVVVVDAGTGIQTQTRRHSVVVSRLGIRKVVVAVNKLDLVEHAPSVFERITDDYRSFVAGLGFDEVTCIATSALTGANVADRSPDTAWYGGPTLLGCLETVSGGDPAASKAFIMPVQRVHRSDPDSQAVSGAASPDDVISAPSDPAEMADQFQADLLWMGKHALLPGRPYRFKIGSTTVAGSVTALKHVTDVDTLDHLASDTLGLNEIGVGTLSFERAVPFDPHDVNRFMGGFVIVDLVTNDPVGAGMIRYALRRSHNLQWQAVEVDKGARAGLAGHRPCVVWFTGLSGAGKSTIANLVEKRLHAEGHRTYLLDGDNIRHGLNRDLGFTEAHRVENVRRIAEVSRLMVDAGLIVLVSFISPFQAERRFARGLVDESEFCEVFVDTPLAVAESRDPKGLYRKARLGQLANFTGIDSPYEPPPNPEVHLDTTDLGPEEAANAVVEQLRLMDVLG